MVHKGNLPGIEGENGDDESEGVAGIAALLRTSFVAIRFPRGFYGLVYG